MPRPPRDFIPGRVYLVSQQGNKLNPVYLDTADRLYATRLLHVCSLRYSVDVLAWARTGTEGRWLLRPTSERGISNLMRDMQSGYSRYLNGKYDHRPCCAQRRMRGTQPCHSRRPLITGSSNWKPRFEAVEIGPRQIAQVIRQLKGIQSFKRTRTRRRRSFRAPALIWNRRAAARPLRI